jgi:hypothetical protein
MTRVPSGVRLNFEATWDAPGLPAAMTVFDDSGVSPVVVQGPTAMLNVISNSYRGFFTPTDGKTYFVFKAIYTDGTFTALDSVHPASTETFIALNEQTQLAQPTTDIFGEVDDSTSLDGRLEDTDALRGTVEDDDELS